MYIAKLKGNVKAGVDVEIGAKTLIVGPNGSGKSTIVNTIELALTARAGDVAGRVDIGREADVMALAKNGASELEALATFDDGVVAAYRTSGSTAKAKKATGDKPSDRCHDEVLPIRSLREALLGSPATARKYLLSKVAGEVSRADVAAMLPAQVRSAWDALAVAIPASTPTPDALIQAIEESGKRQRAASDAAKTARAAGQMVAGSSATPPSDAEIAAAKGNVAGANEQLLWANRMAAVNEKLASIKTKGAAALERQERAGVALAQAKQVMASLPKVSANAATLNDAMRIGEASREFGECLACGASEPMPVWHERALREALAEVADAVAARAKAEADLAAAEREAAEADRAVEALEAELNEALPAQEDDGADVGAAQAALGAAQAKLAALEAARSTWATIQRAESSAIEADRQASEWKIVKEALEVAVGVILDKALHRFVESVQDFLPPTDVFDLRLRDGEREVVAFGLIRGGVLHTALSGAEWARVMAAMASACVPAGRYACVIPEERAFDPKTLSDVCEALGACAHQVVLTSPVMPKPRPKGWTIIKRGVADEG